MLLERIRNGEYEFSGKVKVSVQEDVGQACMYTHCSVSVGVGGYFPRGKDADLPAAGD